jgi:hypothetical protein
MLYYMIILLYSHLVSSTPCPGRNGLTYSRPAFRRASDRAGPRTHIMVGTLGPAYSSHVSDRHGDMGRRSRDIPLHQLKRVS